ncbi:MAG: filamentous hemagglutinin N-terminal domain-containing protein, partial [Sandarakinorhabdus sp.]|nr:filamentous hemagglutinin N-terminal domain-containing protein [Sandarakinorhabdus sp.]
MLLASIAASAYAQTAPALPGGGTFVSGSGTIGGPAAGSLTVTQTSQRGIIDWTSFSIGADARVLIDNGAGATLNRVTGADLSRINGVLKVTGTVYLINPNGVVIGPEGKVLAGGSFVASTRDVTNGAFMAGGGLTASGSGDGTVSNSGSILATEGDVMLIGRAVDNSGNIAAPTGTASLLAGDSILLAAVGGPSGIFVSPDAAGSGNVTNTGRIEAAAAALKAARGDVYTLAGNRQGLISATGTKAINGEIWLMAPSGTVNAGGSLRAKNADASGGRIVANGAEVVVAGTARFDAGGSGGGSVLLGTSAPGGVDLANTLTLADGASIRAGGPQGAGFIETSAHAVHVGALSVDAGRGGTWLVDPIDLTIDTVAAGTIVSALNAGTNVTQITTATSASGAGVQSAGDGDITVAAPLVWTGSGALTLTAFADLNLNAAINGAGGFTGTAGGTVNVAANVAAANVSLTAIGDLSLAGGATVTGANGAILATSARFLNSAGVGALSGGAGNWLVYSANPANDVPGGPAPDFYQYNANPGVAAAGSGNGFLYALSPTLNVTLSGSVTKNYDGTASATFNSGNASVTGLVNGDSAAVTGSFAGKNVGSGIGVTASSITVTNAGKPVYGYSGITPSVSDTIGQITPATITASIVGEPTKTYNGTTTATLAASNFLLSGFTAGEGATVNQPSSITYDAPDAGLRALNATFGNTNFVANASTDFANYILPTSATGAGQILQAPLLISSVLALGKVYDQSTVAQLNTSGANLYGIIGADNVSLVSDSSVGTFATANAGSNIAVSTSGFAIIGTAAANYMLVQPSGISASITPRGLTIAGVAANDKVYDGTITAALEIAGAALVGVLTSDNVTLNAGSYFSNFAQADVGTGLDVSVSGFGLSGGAAGNYLLTQPSGVTASITPRALGVAITGNPTKVYNGSATAVVGSSAFTLTGFVGSEGGTINQTSHASFATVNAGMQLVTADLAVSDYVAATGTKLSNYVLPSIATGTGTIAQAPITIQIDGNPTKTYDGNTSIALGSSNFRLTGFLTGESATVNSILGDYDNPNVGVRGIAAILGAGDLTAGAATLLSNYALPGFVTGFGSITPASLGVGTIYASIAGNPSKVYDGNTVATLTSANFLLTGFAVGEGATVNQTIGTYTDKNVGTQVVSATLTAANFDADSGTNLINYTLPTGAIGTGTITPATLTATIIGNPTKVYNGTDTAVLTSANFDVLGLLPGETIQIFDEISTSYDSIHAGGRTVSAQLATTNIAAGTSTMLSNYILPSSAAGTGTITQAPLRILDISVGNKTYDTTTAAALQLGGARLYGIVGADDVSLASGAAMASFNSANAGSAVSVTANGFAISGVASSDYQLFQPVGLFAAINRAALTITGVSAQDKVYNSVADATLNLGTTALAGVLAPDLGTVALDTSAASASFASVNVGSNIAVGAGGFEITGVQAGNYVLNQPAGLSANITPRPLVANITGNPTKVYDGSTSTTLRAANYQLVGFVGGHSATVPQSAMANYSSANAGSIVINSTLVSSDFLAASGTNLSNYTLPTMGMGMGTITPASLTAMIVGNPTKAYDTATGATLTFANYQLAGFVSGQGATVSEVAGTYGSANAGGSLVTAALDGGDFTGTGATNLANYVLPVTASGMGTINRAVVQVVGVVANDKVYDGNDTAVLDSVGGTVSGLLGSDGVTLNSGSATGVFASKNVGNGIGVAASGFTISSGASANYTLLQPTGIMADITQKAISLTEVRRIYDATSGLPGTSSAYTLSGIVSGDTVAVDPVGITGNYDNKNIGTGKSITLAGLALDGAQSGNYSIASSLSDAAIGTITPASLTASGIIALDKVYDANRVATLDNSASGLVGRLGTDDLTLVTSSSTGTFNNKNAGSNKPVVLAGYSVTGSDLGNYVFTQPANITASISQFTGLTLTSVTKVYSGTTALPTANAAYGLGGIVGTDAVQVNAAGLSGSYASKNADSGLSVSIAGLGLTGADAANYAIGSSVTNALIGTITKKALTASIIGTPAKTYDTTDAATLASGNYQLSGLVAGESATVTEVSGTYSSANAGARTVSVALDAGDFTGNGATLLSNYVLPTAAAGNGQINRAPVTIGGLVVNNKVYNGNVAAVLNTGGAGLVGVYGSDAANVALNSLGASASFASPTVANSVAVTASGFTIAGTRSSNYSLSQPTGLLADITRASLTLTSVTKVYDAGNSAVGAGVSYTLGGIVGSDNVLLDTSGLAGTYAAKNVGSGISVSMSGLALAGTQGSNYAIASTISNAAIGTITPATLTVTGAVALGKIYDGTTLASINHDATTLVGLLGSDLVSFSNQSVTGTFASADAGLRSVTLNGAYAITGTDAVNYTLVQPGNLSATIDRKALSAAIIGTPAKTYDGNAVAGLTVADYALGGFVGAQGATVNQGVGTYDSVNAGGRNVTASLAAGNFTAGSGTNLANYILPTVASGAGLIDPKLLGVTIIGTPTKIYDASIVATLGSANFTLTGFVAGQGANVTRSDGQYASADAGVRGVSASLMAGDFAANGSTLLSNYVLPTSAAGLGQIDRRAIGAAIVNIPTKTYDGNTAATLGTTSFALTGFVASQGADVTQSAGTYASASAGARSVTAVLGVGDFAAQGATNLSNYLLPTLATGAGMIDQKQLAIAISGTPTKTYDANTLATLTSGDFAVSGFIVGEGGTITRSTGTYAAADAGTRAVTATIGTGDFALSGATDLANYIVPASAAGTGVIDPKLLAAVITGTPVKTYDASDAAVLSAGDFTLSGFVAGQGAVVTQTSGLYASSDAGNWGLTATLGSSDFAADSGTLLANYVLPVSAAGTGLIERKLLVTAIIGNSTKIYDGANAATLVVGDYTVGGFIGSQSATVTQVVGTYDLAGAGARTVTAVLGTADYAAGAGTNLANYILPTAAAGAGTIDRKALSVAIVGSPVKTYDGNATATLNSGNYALTGFIAGEDAAVTQTGGTYASANAGTHTVTALLGSGGLAAVAGTDLANYIVPASAVGTGVIDPKLLAAIISGTPVKTYDASDAAVLSATDYTLSGFVAGQGAVVTQALGQFASSDAGNWGLTATLGSGDFAADSGTLLANYVLPVSAAGTGLIERKLLAAVISGTPAKTYDGGDAATLVIGDYTVNGFVGAQGATVNQGVGTYDSVNAGGRNVTASLAAGNFTAG